MSVRVTIHPIGSNILLTDVEAAKKDEWNRRRKIRLKQVREQSKDAASRIRSSVNLEKENRQMAEDKLHDALLKEWQLKKIESLERQYQECLEEVKLAQQKIRGEKEMEALMKERRERLSKLAEERGKKAMDKVKTASSTKEMEKLKGEKVKHFKKTVEDLRSSLVATLPHPKKRVCSPKKKLDKPGSKRPPSSKKYSSVPTGSLSVEPSSKTAIETSQTSPPKKKRVIPSGYRDRGAVSISNAKPCPPPRVTVAKKPAKGTPPKKPRRVIHSFDRLCTDRTSTRSLSAAHSKYQQMSQAAKNLEESVKSVDPGIGVNKDLSRLIKDFSSLAEEEKLLRDQLLSQVQQCLWPEKQYSEPAETQYSAPPQKRPGHPVDQVSNQTYETTYTGHTGSVNLTTGSSCCKEQSVRNKSETVISRPKSVPGGRRQPKEEDECCDACGKYLKHYCAEHSTTVTESTSSSSSLTYMSVSRSMVDSNNSSATTVEGVKVVVSVTGQKNLSKSIKIGKPIRVIKKRKPKKSEKSKATKHRLHSRPASVTSLTKSMKKTDKKEHKAESHSGSLTSYMSPPDRVPEDNHEVLNRVLQEMAQQIQRLNFNKSKRTPSARRNWQVISPECQELYSAKSPWPADSPDSQEIFSSKGHRREKSPGREIRSATHTRKGSPDSRGTRSVTHTRKDRSPDNYEASRKQPSKTDKRLNSSVAEENLSSGQEWASSHPYHSPPRHKSPKKSRSPTKPVDKHSLYLSPRDSGSLGETERLIDYYCNVADKYTDCINNIINALNQSKNAKHDSMNSSSTTHHSPPSMYNDTICLTESLKQLALSSKQPKLPFSYEPSKHHQTPPSSKPSSAKHRLPSSFEPLPEKQPKVPPSFQPTLTSSPDRPRQSKDLPSPKKTSPRKDESPRSKAPEHFASGRSHSRLVNEEDDSAYTAGSQELSESGSSSPDESRPYGNYTLDVSSLTPDGSGAGQPYDSTISRLDENEKFQLQKQYSQYAPVQPAKPNNRGINAPKDLSTILEVDTPSTTHHATSLHQTPTTLSDKRMEPLETSAQTVVEKQQALLQSRIESLQQQINMLNRSQQNCSGDGRVKKVEKSVRLSLTARPKSSSDDSPNGHNTSTESELPDIVEELLKRGLISSPFPWMKELKDKYGNEKHSSGSKRHTSSESDSTPLINEELRSILRNDLSPTELENVCKNLSSSWALSTWKKIAETSRLNSLSSSDSSPGGKKLELADGRSHLKSTPKHSTPIKHRRKHRSSRISSPSPSHSHGPSPEGLLVQDLKDISAINDSATASEYDLTPPDVALHRPQLFKGK